MRCFASCCAVSTRRICAPKSLQVWLSKINRSTHAQSCGSIGSGKSSCHQRQSGRSESRWEKTMLGKSFTHGPSSEKESCSEQICLLPERDTWHCALIHVSIR